MPPRSTHLLLLLARGQPSAALIAVSGRMRSFGTVCKGCELAADTEKVLFEHNVSDGSSGLVTQQWYAGAYAGYPDTRVRMYVDGEALSSVDFNLFMAHGIGPNQMQKPNQAGQPWASAGWASELFAHSADEGLYNMFKVPFARSIRVTVTSPRKTSYYYMIRGVENVPVTVGDMLLPPAARLRLYKTDETVTERQWVTAANFSAAGVGADRGGMLVASSWLVFADASQRFQEGCVRAVIDGDRGQPLWLSSGFEDYFLVAYFHNANTDVHMRLNGFERNASRTGGDVNSVQGYRIHSPDPVLFSSSLLLEWEAPMDSGGACHCPRGWPPPSSWPPQPPTPAKSPVTVQAYAWAYVW